MFVVRRVRCDSYGFWGGCIGVNTSTCCTIKGAQLWYLLTSMVLWKTNKITTNRKSTLRKSSHFLMLGSVHLKWRGFWLSEFCTGFFRLNFLYYFLNIGPNFWDISEHLEIFQNYLKFFRIIWNFFKTFQIFSKISNFLDLSDSWKFSKISDSFQTFPNFSNYFNQFILERIKTLFFHKNPQIFLFFQNVLFSPDFICFPSKSFKFNFHTFGIPSVYSIHFPKIFHPKICPSAKFSWFFLIFRQKKNVPCFSESKFRLTIAKPIAIFYLNRSNSYRIEIFRWMVVWNRIIHSYLR